MTDSLPFINIKKGVDGKSSPAQKAKTKNGIEIKSLKEEL